MLMQAKIGFKSSKVTKAKCAMFMVAATNVLNIPIGLLGVVTSIVGSQFGHMMHQAHKSSGRHLEGMPEQVSQFARFIESMQQPRTATHETVVIIQGPAEFGQQSQFAHDQATGSFVAGFLKGFAIAMLVLLPWIVCGAVWAMHIIMMKALAKKLKDTAAVAPFSKLPQVSAAPVTTEVLDAPEETESLVSAPLPDKSGADMITISFSPSINQTGDIRSAQSMA